MLCWQLFQLPTEESSSSIIVIIIIIIIIIIIKRINFFCFVLDHKDVAMFNFELVPKCSSGEYQLSHTKFLPFGPSCVP